MAWVEISAELHKKAYRATCSAWERTHPDALVEGKVIYPSFFSGTFETHTNPLYYFIWGDRVQVPALERNQLQQSAYEQRLRPVLSSPLYALTISATQYLTNYVSAREENHLNRDANISYPRNQIIVYLCTKLCELGKSQLTDALIEEYEKEFKFIENILQNAHDIFPTSSADEGRRGFHAMLMNTQQCIKKLQHIIKAQIERKTLKEHIGQMAQLAQALRIDSTRFIAQSFNTTLPQKFNFDHFYHAPESREFSLYYKSTIGQWMFDLMMRQKNRSVKNPWLEKPRLLVKSLLHQANAGIAIHFVKNESLMIFFTELHGIALELCHLEHVLFQLEEAAGMAGDYSVAHNQLLFNALNQCLLCWERLSARNLILTHAITEAQYDAIKKSPAKNPSWVSHYRFSLSIQSSIVENVNVQSVGAIHKIKSATKRLSELGYGEYQKKIQQIVEHADSFVGRLQRFRLLEPSEVSQFNSLPSPSLSGRHQKAPSSSVESRLPTILEEPSRGSEKASKSSLPYRDRANHSSFNIAQCLKEAILKENFSFFDDWTYSKSYQKIIQKHLLLLFPREVIDTKTRQDRLNDFARDLQEEDNKVLWPKPAFVSIFDKAAFRFSSPQKVIGSEYLLSQMIELSNLVFLLETFVDYQAKVSAVYQSMIDICGHQTRIKTNIDASVPPSDIYLTELHQRHKVFQADFLSLSNHIWQEGVFDFDSDAKKLLFLDRKNKKVQGSLKHYIDRTFSLSRSIAMPDKGRQSWLDFLKELETRIISPGMLSAAEEWSSTISKAKLGNLEESAPRKLLTKTHQLKEAIATRLVDGSSDRLNEAVRFSVCNIQSHSEEELRLGLENLRNTLFHQNWHVRRYANIGGEQVTLLNRSRIVPQHIFQIIRLIDVVLAKNSDLSKAYEGVFSIAKKALENPPGPLGLFSSWRDPMAQSVYQLLASQASSEVLNVSEHRLGPKGVVA